MGRVNALLSVVGLLLLIFALDKLAAKLTDGLWQREETAVAGLAVPHLGGEATRTAVNPIPVLAYYHISVDWGSWLDGMDRPQSGPYTSDDRAMMRQHVQWAQAAGIDGFIVMWQNTPDLNRRLEALMDVARTETFKLMLFFDGLDFEQQPLPVAQIEADLDVFGARFAGDDVFNMFGKPTVIWGGTWKFSVEQVEQVTASRRGRLLILATEPGATGYARLAEWVDGNAHYWSSTRLEALPGYVQKLATLSDVVHAGHGMWIAPASPGNRELARHDGDTLRRQIDVAIASSPDAIGVISWNDLSADTHIEPSQNYGTRSLGVLADIHNTASPLILNFDSSAPQGIDGRLGHSRLVALGTLVALTWISFIVVVVRR